MQPRRRRALLVWLAAGLAGLVPALGPRLPLLSRLTAGVVRRSGLVPRYAFGLLTGLLPCGLVYAALSMAVAAGSAATGAAAMVAFGAATVPVRACGRRSGSSAAARRARAMRRAGALHRIRTFPVPRARPRCQL